MRHKAMAAVADGQIAIQPNRFEKIWRSWLEVDRDWCFRGAHSCKCDLLTQYTVEQVHITTVVVGPPNTRILP